MTRENPIATPHRSTEAAAKTAEIAAHYGEVARTAENAEPISRRRGMFLASVMRLAAGTSIPNGCGCGNAVWTDAGTNPRGRDLSTDPDFLRRDVKRLRKLLNRDEWIVPDKPLPLGSF